MSGKFEYSWKWHGCEETKTFIDGLRHNDPGPVVSISGKIGKDVSINTYGAISVAGKAAINSQQLAPAMR
jgi:hypothetical protein